MANSRGTVYSLEHERLKISDEEFWNFSFQDMKYDIKANIEFVVKETKQKIHYIGLSQGSVSMLAALSDPDYEAASSFKPHIHKFYCLAPVIYTVYLIFIFSFRKV